MADLKTITGAISQALYERGIRLFRANQLVKVILTLGGAGLATAAQFLVIPKGEQISTWGVVGLFAVGATLLGGLHTAFVEQDAAKQLALAQEAVEAAQDLRDQIDAFVDEFDQENSSLNRAIELYQAQAAMRGAIEVYASAPTSGKDAAHLADALLDVASRSLQLALDFKISEHWTLTIYRCAKLDTGGRHLEPIATTRSTKCPLKDARRIPEGVGVAGICLARREEVIVPDISEARSGNMHEMGAQRIPHDIERYKSLVAAPIRRGDEIWGVVCATSSRPGHFVPDGAPGVRSDEAVRALASMMELAVAVAGD